MNGGGHFTGAGAGFFRELVLGFDARGAHYFETLIDAEVAVEDGLHMGRKRLSHVPNSSPLESSALQLVTFPAQLRYRNVSLRSDGHW